MPRRRTYTSPDSARVRPGNGEARFMDHIAQSLAATEAAIADLTANPVVPPRRPVPAPSPLVEAVRQAHETDRLRWAASQPAPERRTNAMTNRQMETAPDGKKYLSAWDHGVYRITLTVPYSPTVGQWSVTLPDGRVLPTRIDGKDNKWSVAGTRVKSLTAAIDAVVARDAAAEAVAVTSPVAEGTSTPASVVAIEAAEAVRQDVIESAERAEEAAQVQAEARTSRPPRRRRSTTPGASVSPLRPDGPKPPAASTLRRWARDGIAKATDGCRVEPDGRCEHGKPSWLLELGMI